MFKTFTKFFFILVFVFTLFSVSAHASTSGVSSGNVSKATSVEFRTSYSLDDDSASNDNRIRIRQHLEHGFTDDYALRLILTQDKRKNDSIDHASFRIENRFQFFNQKEDGFNGEFRFVYLNNDSRADMIQGQLNGSIKLTDDVQYKQNILLTHEIGKDARSGVALETRFALGKKLEEIDVGLDMMNAFGNLRDQSGFDNQSHEIGPYVEGDVTDHMSYLVGFRQGISQGATDQSLRVFVGYKF